MIRAPILYFHPEGYLIDGPKLMGRNAAGNSFLKGYLQHSSYDQMRILVEVREQADPLAPIMQALNITKSLDAYTWREFEELSSSIIYFPGPTIEEFAWRRYSAGINSFSLCGITHTTASAAVMDSICSWLESPIYDWDAIICTSQVVKDTISLVLQEQASYLNDRFKTPLNFVFPQLPVIPLGINSSEFTFTGDQKHNSRARLEVRPESIVILFSGRLSFHAKAHPLAMYQAIGRLSEKYNLTLIECGWHANDFIAGAYEEAFANVCPRATRILLDGRIAEQREMAWASADIFCSLSDNIQETFGLTPIEAMAAGLPSVVSDWNGYKDTVRDGIDGFRIPTYQPPSGLGEIFSRSHELGQINYDQYCGLTSQLIAVDVQKTIEALEGLISNPGLRKKMGDCARERAQAEFDWSKIIPRYESLWEELDERRTCGAKLLVTKPMQRPGRFDPFRAFASYPTRALDLSSRLALPINGGDINSLITRLEQLRPLKMVSFAPDVQISSENARIIFQFLSDSPKSIEQILSLAPESSHQALHRSLLWLLKLGLLQVV